MGILLIAFGAGVLTVAAPCILPLLPVVIGGTAVDHDGQQRKHRALYIAIGLAASVVIFTLLLKATTTLLGVPTIVWQLISGLIVLFFGITLLWPTLWDKFSNALRLQARTTRVLTKTSQNAGPGRDLLMGAALGPVFSSCSPTYALIVATVLPASFIEGFAAIVAYAIGLALTLMLVAMLGRRAVQKLGWLANPNGLFKRTVGVLFILVAVAVIFGFDKDLQTFVLDRGWYDPIADLEMFLHN